MNDDASLPPLRVSASLYGTCLMVLACLFFAVMAVTARSLSGTLAASQLVLLRFLIGLGGVGGVYVFRRRGPRVPRPGMWVMRGVIGGAAVYTYFLAIELLGVGPATLLNYSSPVYAAPLAVVFLKERPRPHLWVGLAVATVGALLVAYSTADPARPFELGVGAWAGLGSAVLGGMAMTGIRSLRRDTDATTIFLSFCLFGALMTLPLALRQWTPLVPSLWLPVLVVGATSFVGQLLFTHAFGFLSAASGSAATQLTPAFSWVLAFLFLGEQARALTFVGALLCCAGVLWGATVGAAKP